MRAIGLYLLCVAAAVVSLVWMGFALLVGSQRAMRIAVGFDQTANATFGGDEDETISARAWRYRLEWPYTWLKRLIDAAFDDDIHCRSAYYMEKQKRERRYG